VQARNSPARRQKLNQFARMGRMKALEEDIKNHIRKNSAKQLKI
jgi:hypothetical protein